MEAISSKSYEPCCLATSHACSPSVLWDAWLLKLFTSLYKNNIGTAGSSFWNVLHLLHQLNALAFAHSLWKSSVQHSGCNLLFCHLKICMLFPRKSSSTCFAWLSEGGKFHPPSKWHHCTFGRLTLPASGEWGIYPSPLKWHRCTFCWLMPSEENPPVPKSDITALFVDLCQVRKTPQSLSDIHHCTFCLDSCPTRNLPVPVRGVTALSSDSSYKVCQDRKLPKYHRDNFSPWQHSFSYIIKKTTKTSIITLIAIGKREGG